MKQKGEIINFVKIREEKVEERRRRYERVFFKHILGAYAVAEGEGLKAIELVDLSLEGLSFQVPQDSKNAAYVEVGKTYMLRLYFSEDSFIPVQVKIQNKRSCIENGNQFIRFGCLVDQELHSYETYKYFVQFLGSYAENSHQDKGDLKIFFF
ncbi:MAG: PilZ domain-containing protein [Bacteriovoracia bacterium]